MIITADKQARTDSVYHTLVTKLNSKYPIVINSWVDGYEFNPELLKLKSKEFIVIDFMEMGWDYDWSKHSSENYNKRFNTDDWRKYYEWVSGKPLLAFMRELDLPTSKIDGYYPIEYPCLYHIPEPQTKEQFNSRRINCFNYWGRSNEHRLRIHSEIWLNAYTNGGAVCDNIFYLNAFLENENNPDIWVTLNIPHYHRVDISELLKINGHSKICISTGGAGVKCFRHGEAAVNSVMAMDKNNMAWSFLWDETNSIQLPKHTEIETIREALSNPNLYDIYRNGIENMKNYQIKNYIVHLENIINAA